MKLIHFILTYHHIYSFGKLGLQKSGLFLSANFVCTIQSMVIRCVAQKGLTVDCACATIMLDDISRYIIVA